MITTIMAPLICIIMMWKARSENPMSFSMIVLVMSTILFGASAWLSGQIEFSLIFYMMFMGGILIMFTILSSLYPNQPIKKTPMANVGAFLIMLTMAIHPEGQQTYTISGISLPFLSTTILSTMVILILAYFFWFLVLLSSGNMTMRFYKCLKSEIL